MEIREAFPTKTDKLTDWEEAQHVALEELSEHQPIWEYLIQRTAKSPSDLKELRSFLRVEIVESYLHTLAK
ncbi:MAG: hypothetical protein CL671_03180 [Balneola sp.]|nr:hypothetical protein [Balneola sp.]MAC06628.1 hypothetical protein [Balneola sp.]MAO78936.1 hypothetical protein [Balneola sp.]MBF63595.1 hypothetical protein [Balneola sp.]HAW80321.1 hypothetical protein [Balneola sp.]